MSTTTLTTQPAPRLTAIELIIRFIAVAAGIILGLIGAVAVGGYAGWFSLGC